MNNLYKCPKCGATELESDLEEDEVGMGYSCPNCYTGLMRVVVTYTMKQLKKEITEALSTKARPVNKCKIRWYNDAVGMIDCMSSLITERQYKKLRSWASE